MNLNHIFSSSKWYVFIPYDHIFPIYPSLVFSFVLAKIWFGLISPSQIYNMNLTHIFFDIHVLCGYSLQSFSPFIFLSRSLISFSLIYGFVRTSFPFSNLAWVMKTQHTHCPHFLIYSCIVTGITALSFLKLARDIYCNSIPSLQLWLSSDIYSFVYCQGEIL